MNLLCDEAESLVRHLTNYNLNLQHTEVIIAPPYIYLQNFIKTFPNFSWSAQNCSSQSKGAFTGEISAEMLSNLGVKYCIIGHSERRQYFLEDTQLLKAKIQQAWSADLSVIFCIGESLGIYEKQETLTFLNQQLTEVFAHIPKEQWKNLALAYEPIWAIGTGKIPKTEEIERIAQYLRIWLNQQNQLTHRETAVLYGGSCNEKNAGELGSFCPSLDGFLVGGASLVAENFIKIIQTWE